MKLLGLAGTALFAALMTLPGCGGGTRGTGDLTITGEVRSDTGAPIGGAMITLVDTEDTSVTDMQGSFEIVTEPFAGSPQFRIETGGVSVTSFGGVLDDEVVECEVQIRVNLAAVPSATQEIVVKKRRPRPTALPRPTATRAPSDGGPPGGGPGPGGEPPANTPGPSPTATAKDDGGPGSQAPIRVRDLITAIEEQSLTVAGIRFLTTDRTNYSGRKSLAEFSVGEEVEVRARESGAVTIAEKVRFIR